MYLADLIRPCLHTRQCTNFYDSSTAKETQNYCYSNGVKHQVVTYDIPASYVKWTEVLTAKNGSEECFTVESTWSDNERTYSRTFRDSNGLQVATGLLKLGVATVTCNDGNPTAVSNECWNQTNWSDRCARGECEF